MKSFCQHLPLASLNKVIRFFRCCKINSLSILFYPVIVLLCFSQFMTNAQPANDNACNAINLSVGFNSPFTNVNATIQIGEPAIPTGTCTTQGNWCAGEPTPQVRSSVWFKFTVPTTGTGSYAFRVNGNTGTFDSQAALFFASIEEELLSTTCKARQVLAEKTKSSRSSFKGPSS